MRVNDFLHSNRGNVAANIAIDTIIAKFPLPAHCTFAAYTFTPMQILYLATKPFSNKARRIPYRKKQSAVHYNGLPFNILNFKFLLSFYRFVVATRHSAILNMLDLLLSYILRGEDLCPQTHSRGKHSNSRM